MTVLLNNQMRLAIYASLAATMPDMFEEALNVDHLDLPPWVYVKYNRQRMVFVTGEPLRLELYHDGDFICATALDRICDVTTSVELSGFEAKMKVRLL